MLDKLCAGGEVPAATPVPSLQQGLGLPCGSPSPPLPGIFTPLCLHTRLGSSLLACPALHDSDGEPTFKSFLHAFSCGGFGWTATLPPAHLPWLPAMSLYFFHAVSCSACSPEPLFIDPSKGVSTSWTAPDYFFPRRAIALSATRNKDVRRHCVAEW